jgi:hypothetical protein
MSKQTLAFVCEKKDRRRASVNNEEKKELFTHKIVAGSRTYFFDVKEAKDGTKYLVISESRQTGTSYDHSKVMIFEEHLEMFTEGLQKALQFLGVKSKAYNLDNIRQKYPKAYERWTSDEDERLKTKYHEGIGIVELATFFQRQPSAIRSRLAKLGLLSAREDQK